MANPSPSDHFSPTYAVARAKFLDAARAEAGELVHLENPSKGADGERLFTDIALLGPRSATSVLVVCSGTHGIEGFCGSGIQTGLLREGVARRLPPDVRLVEAVEERDESLADRLAYEHALQVADRARSHIESRPGAAIPLDAPAA